MCNLAGVYSRLGASIHCLLVGRPGVPDIAPSGYVFQYGFILNNMIVVHGKCSLGRIVFNMTGNLCSMSTIACH